MSAPPERRTRMSRDARRDQLLDAAAELVIAQGLDAVTMEGLGAQAGVSKALPYVYFGNSADVVSALFDREMAELDRRVGERMAEATTFEDRLRATLRAMFELVAERGVLVGQLLNGTATAGRLESQRRDRDRSTQAFWGRLIEKEFGLPKPQAANAASMCLTAGAAVIDLWIHRRGSRRDLTETYVSLVMGGLREMAARA